MLGALSAAVLMVVATAGRAGTTDLGYDPLAIGKVGSTYARYHFDFSQAFAPLAQTIAPPEPTRDELRRLGYRFSPAIDDVVRERITATIAAGDAERAAALQALFANDRFLDQATQAIRVFGLRETDIADVTAALVVAGFNASRPVALTAAQGLALSRQIRRAMVASPILPALDDTTKQTIVTEMAYQVLFWESDASTFGYGRDPTSLARLRVGIATSLATLGIPLVSLRAGDAGLEFAAATPLPKKSPSK